MHPYSSYLSTLRKPLLILMLLASVGCSSTVPKSDEQTPGTPSPAIASPEPSNLTGDEYPFSISGISPGMKRAEVEKKLGTPGKTMWRSKVMEVSLRGSDCLLIAKAWKNSKEPKAAFHGYVRDDLKYFLENADKLKGEQLEEDDDSYLLRPDSASALLDNPYTIFANLSSRPTHMVLEELLAQYQFDHKGQAFVVIIWRQPKTLESGKVEYGVLWEIERDPYQSYPEQNIWLDYVPDGDEVESVSGSELICLSEVVLSEGDRAPSKLLGSKVEYFDGEGKTRYFTSRVEASHLGSVLVGGRYVQFEIYNYHVNWIAIYHDRHRKK